MSKEIAVPVVIDTNVLIPSLYRSTHILRFILSGELVLVWNQFLLNEAYEIINTMWELWYSKRMHPDRLHDAIDLLDTICKLGYSVPEMPEDWPPVSKDRDDDPFLWTAVTGREFIISRDRKHLLKLVSFRGIPIGKPGDFFQWVIAKYPMST